MKNVKRACAVFLLCGALAPACACAAGLKVVTSFYPMYIMARNVCRGVPGVEVANLTPAPTGCLHEYALTARDMRTLAGADVLVVNGAGMETFLGAVAAGRPGLTVVRLSEGVPLIAGNPHVWVSVEGCISEVQNLGRAMASRDPAHASRYEANTAAYVARLEALRDVMHAALAPYRGRALITFHEAFPYFAREFGFTIAAVVEREPGSEPSARELAETITLIKKNGAAALFGEPQYSDRAARTIARETGARVYVLDPAVTGPDDDGAYLAIMEKNLSVLKEAFEAGTPRP